MLGRELEPFRKALFESLEGIRKGDKPEETKFLREKILKGKIGIVTNNEEKFSVFQNTFSIFGITNVVQIKLPTEFFDLTETPALSKALSGRFLEKSDFYVARGRLGIPGSGALTVMVDKFGHVVSAVTSPPHHIHSLSLETATIFDVFRLLNRLGLVPQHKGITERTKTVYSSLTVLQIARKIAERKHIPLREFKGDKLLIVGGYLDGVFLASFLKNQFKEIHIYDIENAVLEFANILGLNSFSPEKEVLYDVILNLTGFGGVVSESGRVSGFKGRVIISEEASGSKSFQKLEKPHFFLTLKKGRANTSGTMTLTVNTVRRAAEKLEELEGVLYAVPQLLFSEMLMFNLKSARSFYEIMELPALAISCVEGAPITTETVDGVIEEVIDSFEFGLERV